MRIFVTGLSGFVASNFCDYLLTVEPDSQIYGIRRWKSDEKNIAHFYGDPRVTFIEADLMDRGSLNYALRLSTPEFVTHFGAQSYPGSSFDSPVHTVLTNTVGTLNLLDEIRIAKRDNICDPIILNVSTSEVYGIQNKDEMPMKETNSIRGSNPYGISKVGADLFGQFYYNAYGLKVITTRMFSHTGKRRGKYFALSNFAYQIATHEKNYGTVNTDWTFKIRVGNLNSVRTWSHIDDAVKAYYIALKKAKIGEVYNIAGNDVSTIGQALDILLSKSIIPRNLFEIVVVENRMRKTDISLQIPSCEKFYNDTGWKAVKNLDDICCDLLDYWRQQINSGKE